jgi:putative membrane protein
MAVKYGIAVAGALLFLPLLPAGASAASAPSAQDRAFLIAAHQANLAEIAGGHLAGQKGVSAQVRALGTRFAADHTTLDSALVKTAEAAGVALPATPNPEQQALAAKYRTAPASAFDALYLTTQMTAHTQALAAGRTELAKGADPAVKTVVATAAPVILAHHDGIRAAERALDIYGTPSR